MNGDMYQAEHKETEPPPLKDQMDYAMKHFNFIAEQRLKTFHFYAILLAGSIAGTLSGIKESVNVPLFLICGVLHFLLALVFYIIERRNLHLLGIARGGVAFVEQSDGWPERLRLCCIDYRETRAWSRRKYSYRVGFAVAYVCQALLGIGLIACALVASHRLASGGSEQSLRDSSQTTPAAQSSTSKMNPTAIPANSQGVTPSKATSNKD
jgi:hypothetical protein